MSNFIIPFFSITVVDHGIENTTDFINYLKNNINKN